MMAGFQPLNPQPKL